MESLHVGQRSLRFPSYPVIQGWASTVGKKEAEGPLSEWFDVKMADTKFREPTWERAETQMQKITFGRLLEKSGLASGDLDVVFSGDLLNQCIASSFAQRQSGVPVLGLYGACSTMAEALLIAAAGVHAGFARNAVAMTSSHFAASERQYRFPLGYGGQRTPTAQWTVTGCGAALICSEGSGPRITGATVGTVADQGVKDANNMGAAMAWAAYQTIRTHLEDFGRPPTYYDLIVTGDLGLLGHSIVSELFAKDGTILGERYQDCGLMIYDREKQDVHCGGSGCGCSASVLCSKLLKELEKGTWNRILFCGTGALLSPVSVQQKEPIPAICHAVAIEKL